MNKQQLESFRDHMKAGMDLGLEMVPSTYFAGVKHSYDWAKAQLKILENKAKPMPALDEIRKKTKVAA